MQNGWREELPDPVLVPLSEIRWAISQLEHRLERSLDVGDLECVAALDAVIGRMTRWVWDLLGDLDDEDDYDE